MDDKVATVWYRRAPAEACCARGRRPFRVARRAAVAGVALVMLGCAERAAAKTVARVAPEIAGEYIVVLPSDLAADSVAGEAARLTKAYGGRVTHRYAETESTLRGFAVTGMDTAHARTLTRDRRVDYVEQAASAFPAWRRKAPGWALDRIDQRSDTPSGDYRYSADGDGVRVYVLDTGIDSGHAEFSQNRPTVGFDATQQGGTGTPCDGHGTAIAGLIAGNSTGVAPGADLVNVKVLDCNPIGGNSTADIIAGIDWVTAHAVAPAVVNLSLQLQAGASSPTLRTAIANLRSKDVVVVAAAGNDNDHVAQVEPANYPHVLAVGGSMSSGRRWVDPGAPSTGCSSSAPACGSNFGAGVGLFAPASARTAALGGGYTTPTGTSAAAAIVSGVAAATLQAFWEPPKPGASIVTPPGEEARRILLANATAGLLTDVRTSPNRFVFAETWPIGVGRWDLPGLSGPTSVSSSVYSSGTTASFTVAGGLSDRFDTTPTASGDPYSAQTFDEQTARWSSPPTIGQGGCSDVHDAGVAYLWLACTRMTPQGPSGAVRAIDTSDGAQVGETAVGLGLAPAGQPCTQPRSIARAVRVDANGGVYAVGDAWCGTGQRTAFLAKLDTQASTILWQKRIFDQGTSSSVAYALAVANSTLTIAGAQTSPASSPTARVGQFRSSDGLPLAAASPARAVPSAAHAVSADEASQRLYAGATEGAPGAPLGVLSAFTPGLTKLWEQRLDGAQINGVAALKDGVLAAGETRRLLPFWPITAPATAAFVGRPLGRPRGFLMRFDESGALRWTRYVEGAVVGIAAQGQHELGDSVLADAIGVSPELPCSSSTGLCLQPPRTSFVESFRVK
jgi:subtilisin family serine protease